jgi:hypothetical protein
MFIGQLDFLTIVCWGLGYNVAIFENTSGRRLKPSLRAEAHATTLRLFVPIDGSAWRRPTSALENMP